MAPIHEPISSPTTSHNGVPRILSRFWKNDLSPRIPLQHPLPRTSAKRLSSVSNDETILYLAYGSNLSAKTFKGTRGIQPLSAINVHVPSLDLTFDLAGIPYIEPCFANTRWHTSSPPTHQPDGEEYHKDRWHKGLIGVVYEVTPEDYRTIIATEGGGASYLDVVVPCFGLPEDGKVVDETPSGRSFKAHTLLQPTEEDTQWGKGGTRVHRPDPSYAQPSARYLKLITDGAEEHFLPDEYLAYLYNIRPYTITTIRQRLGQGMTVTVFGPMLALLMALGRIFADDEGKIPAWLATAMRVLFGIVWAVYDGFMVKAFGEGERTLKQKESKKGIRRMGDEEMCSRARCAFWEKTITLGGSEGPLR